MPVQHHARSPRALFLFDLDGTLVRGGDRHHWDAFNYALQLVYGVPATLDGVPLGGFLDRQIARAAVAPFELDPSVVDAGLDRVMTLMAHRYRELAGSAAKPDRLLPGADLCVRACTTMGHIAVIATGSSQDVARQKLHHIGLGHLGSGAYGDEVDERPDLYDLALSRVTSRYDIVVVVGDTPRDIAAARSRGHSVVAVATGRWSEPELAEHDPDLLLGNLEEYGRMFEWLSQRRITG